MMSYKKESNRPKARVIQVRLKVITYLFMVSLFKLWMKELQDVLADCNKEHNQPVVWW